MKKLHALHNEKACDYLLESKQYNDWVVTTAFYAALHYVQFELFPLKDDNEVYANFNIYFSKVLKKKNTKLSKHSATIKLVSAHIKTASSYYRWLHDTCMTSRYSDYKVSEMKAQTAKKFLLELKKQLRK